MATKYGAVEVLTERKRGNDYETGEILKWSCRRRGVRPAVSAVEADVESVPASLETATGMAAGRPYTGAPKSAAIAEPAISAAKATLVSNSFFITNPQLLN